MDKVKLTKTAVDRAEARQNRYTIFDRDVSGFGLRVYPTGKKSWVFEYRAGEGGRRAPKRRITIGSVSDFTPDKARSIAEMYRAQTRLGGDPQRDKVEKRAAVTVRELADAFLTEHMEAKRKASTTELYRDILTRLVLPKTGTRRAQDVTRADVARLHLSMKGTPYQANRVLAVIASMYNFGVRRGLIPEGTNPARHIEKYKEERRERFLSVDELERLGTAIRMAETDGIPWAINPDKKTKHVPKRERVTRIGEHAAAALRLLIFTGARLREILHLTWDEVDLERGLLQLADSKTGRKTIILNAPAMAVLANLTRAGKYVIAGKSLGTKNEKPRSDLKRPWTVVSKQAGLEGLRIHDLRHNFASFGAGGGLGLPIIGKLLGHTQPATTARYAHLDADPLRRASDAIGSVLAEAMGEKRESATVVPMRRNDTA